MSYIARRVSKIEDFTGEQRDEIKNFIHKLSKEMRGIDFHYKNTHAS